MSDWQKFDHDDAAPYPTEPGVYAVMVSGDSERDGAHVFYEFDDYRTFATLYAKDADGHQAFHGIHDEECHTFFAWYGPIVIPPIRLPIR